MYPLDINTNTALEGQADRTRAVNAYGSHQSTPAAMPRPALNTPAQAALALAVVAPVMALMAWGLLAH